MMPLLRDHVETQGAMMAPRDGLLQMIQQNDEKHEKMHRRLRGDIDKLEEQIHKLEDQTNKGFQSLRDGILTNSTRIDSVEKTPPDVTKLVFNSKVVVSLVIVVLGIAAAVWSIRSGMDKIADKMEAMAKLQDVQTAALKTSVDDMKRRQELQQYEIQGLKEAILTGKGRVPR